MQTVNVLGTEYTIDFATRDTDSRLASCDGVCDTSAKTIIIDAMVMSGPGMKADLPRYRREVLRHEIIHAFMYESGLTENGDTHNERIVDWIAIQFLKMLDVFESAGCLKGDANV